MHRHIPLEAARRGAIVADLAEVQMRRAEDDSQERAQAACSRDVEAFRHALIVSGTVRVERMDGVTHEPVSDYIGEMGDRQLLADACAAALLGDSARAAKLMRDYADSAAHEFATMYGGDE